jgi:ribosomal-protein-alanine N-acetyltransferase
MCISSPARDRARFVAPDGYVLRPFELEDLGQVSKVEEASFPERPYTKVDFLSCLLIARGGFIVASRDSSVVGYVIAMGKGGAGVIQSIAVSPESRGKGIGEALMRAAVEYLALRFRRVVLLVDAKNEKAIRLYHRLSFLETGRKIEDYYPNGDDAVEMAKEL